MRRSEATPIIPSTGMSPIPSAECKKAFALIQDESSAPVVPPSLGWSIPVRTSERYRLAGYHEWLVNPNWLRTLYASIEAATPALRDPTVPIIGMCTER